MGIKTLQADVAGAPLLLGQRLQGASPRHDAARRRSLEHQTRTGGRNNHGRITIRFRGGGHKQRYRIIDFKRDKIGVPAKVASIEYDPNRTRAHRAPPLRRRREALHPRARRPRRSATRSSRAATPTSSPATALPLRYIPLGTTIHNIEMKKGKGGQLVRSAGTAAQLMAKDGDYAQVRLPSRRGPHGPPRLPRHHRPGLATSTTRTSRIGKAGRTRWLGRRPHNRGVTMNPVDHPMGGGEGRTSGGRHPCSPWGQLSKGLKTRNNKRTDEYDRQAPRQEGFGDSMPRSVKKGPFIDGHLIEKIDDAQKTQAKKVIKTWSRRSHDHARGRRPHVRRAQRPQVRAGVRHREHGRPQARRVRADAHVPRPRRATARAGTVAHGPRLQPAHRASAEIEASTMEAKASLQAIAAHLDAQGARWCCDMVRGQNVAAALDQLRFTRKAAAPLVSKLLDSAIANAQRKKDGVDLDRLYVKTAFADKAPTGTWCAGARARWVAPRRFKRA